jgi:hypothetical protein
MSTYQEEKEKLYKCYKCYRMLDESNFCLDRSRPDNVSKSCANCMRKYLQKYRARDKWKILHIKNYRKYISKYPEKQKAHELVRKEYGNKIIGNCTWCDAIKSLELHHEDYSKPLEVVPVCFDCHFKIHKDKEI